jgi:chromosome partitioning protein
MLTVLVTNIKGGCGKTTLATNLAGAFANTGFVTVLADCDRQRSSLAWGVRRPESLPPIEAVNWVRALGTPPAGTTRLVIDAPAGLRRKQANELVRRADVILLPVLPSLFDENATMRFLRLLDKLKPIRKNRRALAVIGNRVRMRTRAARELDMFFAGVGFAPLANLRDSQIYPVLAAEGRSLFDLGTRQAENFAEDWHPLLRFLGDTALALGA